MCVSIPYHGCKSPVTKAQSDILCFMHLLQDIVGIDYSCPLHQDGRLVLECRLTTKRVFSTVHDAQHFYNWAPGGNGSTSSSTAQQHIGLEPAGHHKLHYHHRCVIWALRSASRRLSLHVCCIHLNGSSSMHVAFICASHFAAASTLFHVCNA